MAVNWCEQHEVHVGFVRVGKTKNAMIAPECMECGLELVNSYYYDIENAEPICDVCFITRSNVGKVKPQKPPKKTNPRVKGEPTKKRGRPKKESEDV